MLNWFAVYVNAKHEKKIVQKLLEKKIEAYVPITKKLKQWSDRKKWVESPMLSGYVFVKINIFEKENVLNCPGVVSFVKFNNTEARIRDFEIDVLKSIETNGYDVLQETEDLKLLDEIEITQGQLKGLKGTVVLIKNINYVQIQLESLHQSIKVKLPLHILKKTLS